MKQIEVITGTGVPQSHLPFSPAIKAGDYVFISGQASVDDEGKIVHKDGNGNILKDGDSVVLIKDLDVKGANFTAKRGAAVHNIKLVWDNAEQIEGRVEGQHIVILTQYVKKTK
jgi:alkylphosphonate utilization operon protein PhnA